MSRTMPFNLAFVISGFAVCCCFALANLSVVHGQVSSSEPLKRQLPDSEAVFGSLLRKTGNPLFDLLLLEEVRSELKVDLSQEKELSDAIRAIQEERKQFVPKAPTKDEKDKAKVDAALDGAASALATSSKKFLTSLEEILDPIQVDRLLGIYVQQSGRLALCSNLVTKRLAISADQSNQIMKIALNRGPQEFSFSTPNALETLNLRRKDTENQMFAVLTDAQKLLFEELRGKKFEFRQDKSLKFPK